MKQITNFPDKSPVDLSQQPGASLNAATRPTTVASCCGCTPPLRLEIQHARRSLSQFILDDAAAICVRVGFSWVAQADAPSTYSDLREAFVWSLGMREPLAVSSLYNHAPATSPSVNLAHRFAHDCKHVLADLTFDLDDEAELAIRQLDELRQAGFSASSLEHRIYHADTIGQVLCLAKMGRFPRDQLRFALNALEHGVEGAIGLEARPCCQVSQVLSETELPAVDEMARAA